MFYRFRLLQAKSENDRRVLFPQQAVGLLLAGRRMELNLLLIDKALF